MSMSTASYSRSQRGGGRGETGRMRAAIVAKIDSWVQNANWEDPDRAERVFAKIHEAPEKFVSPNPNADHKEEASRIYEELKEEYGLRTEREAQREARTWDDRADDHYKRKERESESEPEPESEPQPESEPESAPAEADQATVEQAVTDVELGESEPQSESAGVEGESLARALGILLGKQAIAGLRSLRRLVVLTVGVLAPILVSGAKQSARFIGALLGFTLRLAVSTTVFAVKVSFAVIVGFSLGLARGVAA